MRVNFSKVKVQASVEGEPEVIDLRKILGNLVWRDTGDIPVSDLGREIYFSKDGTDIPDKMLPEIRAIVGRSPYIAPIKRALDELLTIKEEK